jgi:coproporphyrinogen III oxidase-like Fe-S oxidoreductase
LEPLRRWNVRDWVDYARRAAEGELAVAGEEEVSGDARCLERIWLALRTDRGLPWEQLTPAAVRLAARWCERGWARREAATHGDRLRLSAEGWLVLDRLAVELDSVQGPRPGEPAFPAAG